MRRIHTVFYVSYRQATQNNVRSFLSAEFSMSIFLQKKKTKLGDNCALQYASKELLKKRNFIKSDSLTCPCKTDKNERKNRK